MRGSDRRNVEGEGLHGPLGKSQLRSREAVEIHLTVAAPAPSFPARAPHWPTQIPKLRDLVPWVWFMQLDPLSLQDRRQSEGGGGWGRI